MRRKAGECGAVTLHLPDGRGWHQLRAQHPEEVDKADQKIADAAIGRLFRQVLRHQYLLFPGIQSVPASGTPAMAAASTVSAARSSGSRLWRCHLPQAPPQAWASIVSTVP